MCLRPQIFTNPRIPLYGDREDKEVYLFGVEYPSSIKLTTPYLLREYDYEFKKTSMISSEFLLYALQSCFIYLPKEKIKIPLYISLPCRKCKECIAEYKHDILGRALIEGLNSTAVVFYTLTYDDDHLPPEGLRKSDVALAFSNLRNHIWRYINPKLRFTNLYVGEYGVDPRRTRRAHYHGIMFFSSPITDVELRKINEMFYPLAYTNQFGCVVENRFYTRPDTIGLQHWWPHGQIFDFQSARNTAALVEYVTKYISKQLIETDEEHQILDEAFECYRTPCFVQMPKRIGLGCKYLDKYKDFILAGNNCITLIDPLSGRCKNVRVPLIFIDHLYKPISKLQPCGTFYAQLFIELSDVLIHRLGGKTITASDFNDLVDLLHNHDSVLSAINTARYTYRIYTKIHIPKRLWVQKVNAVYYAEQKMSNEDIFYWLSQLYEDRVSHYLDSDVFMNYVTLTAQFKQSLKRDVFNWSELNLYKTKLTNHEIYASRKQAYSEFDLVR